MYFTIYKTKNLINDKVYIGKHKTKNLSDNYLGSGQQIKNAIKKYGKHNFEKEILFIFNNEEEMNAKEKELVTEEFCQNQNSYNMHEGGYGGFLHIRSNPEYKNWCSKGGKNGPFSKNPFIGGTQFVKGDPKIKELSNKANAYRKIHGLSEEHKHKIKLAALKREEAKRNARVI